MSLTDDLALCKADYDILELVRELQETLYGAGAHGLVRPAMDHDQKTRCPVHEDGTPSAKVYVRTNSVYCFVCGQSWDPVGLWMVHHNVPMPVAVRALMGRLGMKPPPPLDLDSMAATLAPKREMSPELLEAVLRRVAAWASDYAGPRTTGDDLPQPWLEDVLELLVLARTYPVPADGWSLALRAVAWAEELSRLAGAVLPPAPIHDEGWLLLSGVT